MLTKMMTVFVAAAALTARLPLMHLHSRAAFRTWLRTRLPLWLCPLTRSTAAIRPRDICQRHRP